MMCYKDMTFCTFYQKCTDASKCGRALTDRVKLAAQQFNMPVSIFGDKPDCYIEIDSAVIVEENTNNEVNDGKD